MSPAVSFSETLETQTSDSARRGPGGFPLFFYDDKHWDKLLHVLSVSLVSGRHLWARCLSGRSLGAQRVPRLTAGTDTPLSASKGPVGREPSPFIFGATVRFLFQKCVTNTSPSHGSCWQQLQQSSCCQVLFPVLPHSAYSPPLRVLFSADQQGSINEQPLTITSQLWLTEENTMCSCKNQLHLPDNCAFRVWISNRKNVSPFHSPHSPHYNNNPLLMMDCRICLICINYF